MDNDIYVTTSIPYVNGRPHVGFALELVQADAVARYHRLAGRSVRLQTGTDENAFKNVQAAQQQGVTTAALVEHNAEAFRALSEALDIGFDSFVRTTQDGHRQAVTALWQALRPGDVYRRAYEGLYCSGCEDFYLARDLSQGLCPEHGVAPQSVAESNYFFRLSAYGAQIEEALESGRIRVVPAKRRREVLAFVRRGLQDISISRDAQRQQGWGIAVPGDPSQVVYVWIDALINYLTGFGFGQGEDWRSGWAEEVGKIHVIGKNVWKFHAVYWPALLLSAGLPLPNEIVVHGFLTEEGRKISKSSGGSVDPLACIDQYGVDAVRYYLLRGVPPTDDGDFSLERLGQLYTQDLRHGLGNVLRRLLALAARSNYRPHLSAAVPPAPEDYTEALQRYQFDRALASLWGVIDQINRSIQIVEPWTLSALGQQEDLYRHLDGWFGALYQIGYWLRPFLPRAAEEICTALKAPSSTAAPILFPVVEDGP
ncbi:MAG: methionine--tRNA ligase [Candidatus Latescibacteria bacterium]|nr:methionine--tRNA ligase [Candidatus Latescibacterota bacterium]